MSGTHNFLGKAFDLFMNMDKTIGAYFDKGLSQLKAVVEAQEGKDQQPATEPKVQT